VTADIRTDRLDLIPMTPAFLRASLGGDLANAEIQVGLTLQKTWPDIQTVLALRLEQLEVEPKLQPWLLRAIGLRNSREMIGHIGFHTSPGAEYLEQWSPGGAEFGVTIFEPHRRKGYAREASLALMQWARDVHDVTSFLLTISPSNGPSLALASGLGFVRAGIHLDDVDGPEDVFVLDVGQRSVMDKVPSHMRRCPAAEPESYATW
jgi:RimJ/RimL family protein N-acetyltransferase